MTTTTMPDLLREIVAYCREAGHDWSSLNEAEHMLVTLQAQQSPQGDTPAAAVSDVVIGRLPTMNQDPYPSLGDWWVQLWDGSGDDAKVIARAYGSTPQEAHERASMIARAILALRPQAVVAKAQMPMTEDEMLSCLSTVTYEVPARLPPGWRKVMQAVEAHHGIKGN